MNLQPPTISVLMPVYNRQEYAPLAVESILQQTFGDFEFIIVNDGSTDGVSEILRRYAAADPRIVLIEQENTGYAVALNRGLERARGEFIARMDSDDASLPERFALQVEFLRANPRVVAVGGQALRIDEDGDPLSPLLQHTDPVEIEQKVLGVVDSSKGTMVHPSVMMRREALERIGGYRPEFEPAEDRDLWLRLSEVGLLANLEETVIHYRMHSGSVSRERSAQQHANATRAIHEAYQRRGQPVPETIHMWQLQDRTPTEAESRSSCALTAARNNYYRTALKHARRALAGDPFNGRAWKAITISLLGASTAHRLAQVARWRGSVQP